MINYSFSIYDLEYFLLIFVRVTSFIFIVPFFGMNSTPARVRIGLSFFIAWLLYGTLTPNDAVIFETDMEYAIIVLKEAITGLLIGFSPMICISIVNFAGSVIDMEIGLSMVNVFDPATKENVSITGAFYQNIVMMMLIATGMHRYLIGALADSFLLIPVNGAIFNPDSLLSTMLGFMSEYILIGFRICLPVFCVTMILNSILGVLAKVSPQLNMFSVGIQLKILVGLGVLFFTTAMLPNISNYIFVEMKELMVSFVGGMM